MGTIKNKDNIQILAGQIWADDTEKLLENTTHSTVIGFYEGQVIAHDLCQRTHPYFEISVEALHRLLSCPVMGEMSRHAIVTDEQRGKYLIPECAERFIREEWRRTVHAGTAWRGLTDITYRVPADFTDWEPIEPKSQIPEGYRLVTDEEKQAHEKPAGIGKFYPNLYPSQVMAGFDSSGIWHGGFTYAVPLGFTFQPPPPEAPEELSFELDWSKGYPTFDKGGLDGINPAWYDWHGFTSDGVAYTRLGFLYGGRKSLFSALLMLHPPQRATHIVFMSADGWS